MNRSLGSSLGPSAQALLEPERIPLKFDDMAAVGETVQERRGEPGVTENFRPAGEVQVGGYQHRAPLVPALSGIKLSAHLRWVVAKARDNPRSSCVTSTNKSSRQGSRWSTSACRLNPLGNVLPKLPERLGILYAVSGVSAPVEPKSKLRSLAV